MESKEHRRKTKRYPVRWKAAIVFDKADGKPILHSQTQDLSLGGTAIHSQYGDLTGSMVTLLLVHPGKQGGEAQKMLKVRARVVSTGQSSAMSGFRHGLSFIRSKGDGLDILEEILGATETAKPTGERIVAADDNVVGTPAGAGSSLLDQLKQRALAMQAEASKADPQIEKNNAIVSGALERAYRYLKEIVDQLNIVKPAFRKAYSIVGVSNFDGLAWQEGRIDFRVRESLSAKKLYDQVTLSFRLSADKQLQVTRDNPAHEKLNQVLLDNRIVFNTEEERSELGSVVRTTFLISCEVKANLQFVGNYETGNLLLKTRNIERFGTLDHLLAPEAVSEKSLEEFVNFILGESNRIGSLLLKRA